MKFVTEIQAKDPATGEMLLWAGPHIEAISFKDAQHICNTTGLGYCKVVGRLISEIKCGDGITKLDFEPITTEYSNDN